MKTKVQKIGAALRSFGRLFNWAAAKCETSGDSLEKAKGLGDVIATGTQATRLDRFAEWLAVDVLGREGCGCPARRNRLNTLWAFNKPKLIIAIPEYNDRGGLWAMLQHLWWEVRQSSLDAHVEILVVTQTPIIQAPERRIQDFGTPQQKELPPVPTTVIAGREPLENLCKTMTARGGVKVHYREFTEVIGTGPAKAACINFARQLGGEWVWVCDSHLHFSPGSIQRFYKWVCKTKNRNSKHLYHCPLLYDDLNGAFTNFETRKPNKLALIGGDNLWGQFRTEVELFKPDADPKEIQAHGGFWFATRTDVPFGHPLFKGFGDPETIIHEQRRSLGHKVYCLPARMVSCVHRFLNVCHRDTHSPQSDAIINHWIGVQSLRVHFMKEAVAAGFNEPTEWLIAAWIEAFPDRKDMILQSAAKAAEKYFAWEEQQRQIKARIESQKASAEAVQKQYEKAAATVSDINEHLPTLKRLAQGAEHVVEFGVRSGESTKAFLAAGVKRLSSYDLTPGSAPGVVSIDGQSWERHFGPEVGDSLKVDIEECDVVFIDTLHTADQVHAELSRHFSKIRPNGVAILHDSSAPFGDMDQDGGKGGGVNGGINRFLSEHADWHIAERFTNNHGLVVLRRKQVA